MPLPIDLDPNHWVNFGPGAGATEVVKILGNAGYYSDNAAPPELKNPGEPIATGGTTGTTELAVNGEVTVAGTKWFLQKLTSAERKGEELAKPAILESRAVTGAGEGIVTSEIANEAVTAAKLAKEAVTEAKYAAESLPATATKIATLPAIAAEKAVKTGVAGIDRVSMSNFAGDGTEKQKFKLKHGLESFGVAVTLYTNVASKPGSQITAPGSTPKVVVTNAKEIELDYSATVNEPAAGVTGVIWAKVEA